MLYFFVDLVAKYKADQYNRGPNIDDRDYIVVQLTKITLLYKIKALAYLTRVVKFCLVGNDDEGSGGGVGQNQ